MTRSTFIREVKPTGRTLVHDRRRAPLLEAMCRTAIRSLFALAPDLDWPALSRALVQEVVRHDAALRGPHEAATWASAQARRIDPPETLPSARAAAKALFAAAGDA